MAVVAVLVESQRRTLGNWQATHDTILASIVLVIGRYPFKHMPVVHVMVTSVADVVTRLQAEQPVPHELPQILFGTVVGVSSWANPWLVGTQVLHVKPLVEETVHVLHSETPPLFVSPQL